MSEQRAHVSVVAGGGEQPVASNTGNTPIEPEAAAPAPPPQETQPDLGGNALPNPSPEDKAEALGGGFAAQMRARFESMSATEEFPVPGWETADGSPGLILVARAFGDRRNWGEGVSNEVFIAKSTHKLLYVDDQGQRHEIPGGWGPALAEMIGVHAAKAADLVAMVISKPNPSDTSQRIPNVAGIGGLATELIEWSKRATRAAEEDLGE